MENSITGEITKLLKEGKTVKEIINMGYKTRTVYHVQSRLKKQASSRKNEVERTVKKSTKPMFSTVLDDIFENDPEIIHLKKEVRKAELNRSLREITARSEIAELADLAIELGSEIKKTCQHYDARQDACFGLSWPEESAIPKTAGKPLHIIDDDSWCVRPSPLLCVLCPRTDEPTRF